MDTSKEREPTSEPTIPTMNMFFIIKTNPKFGAKDVVLVIC